MSDVQVFVQILQGLLTPVIAVVAVLIALQQSKTARDQHKVAQDKLKLDLFDRRYKVYQGVMEFIAILNNTGKAAQEVFGRLYEAIEPARFLFEDEVLEYVLLVRQRAIDLRNAMKVMERAAAHRGDNAGPAEAQVSDASMKERELLGWFYNQPEDATRQFLRYLDFKRVL